MTQPTPPPTFEAAYAVALNLLMAGLTNDGARLDDEVNRLLTAPPKVVGAVIGFLTAHAADAAAHQHGSREAAIDAVSAQLAHLVLTADFGQLP